jgi:hypothetical protein
MQDFALYSEGSLLLVTNKAGNAPVPRVDSKAGTHRRFSGWSLPEHYQVSITIVVPQG